MESVEVIRSYSGRNAGEDEGMEKNMIELQLPKACSTVNGGLRSTQWAKGVMQDLEDAAGAEDDGRAYW